MKINFTKSLLTLIAVAFSLALTAQTGAEYIWGGPNSTGAEYDNSTFNGGLNDWTTEGLSSKVADSSANAIWTWTDDSTASKGSFWQYAPYPIESPTASNGAAVFDSDFLDNGGDYATNPVLGDGLAPSPHAGVLTSPSMDCSGEPRVAVLFYQSYRNFSTKTTVEASNDGGNTWTSYAIKHNDELKTYFVTGGDSWRWVDISATAANQADVRIRFKFDGDYYYWIIDDVALIKAPTNDLAITDYFYAAGSYQQPSMTDVSCDTMGFSCHIANIAKVDQDSVTAYVRVLDEDDNVIHVDSVELGMVRDTVTNDLVEFPVKWSPGNTEGRYRMIYSLSNDGDDFYPLDNADGRAYEITSNQFAKGSRARNYFYPATAPTSYLAEGCIYNTCDFVHDGLEVAIDSLGFSVADRGRGSLVGAKVTIWVKKVLGDIKPPKNLLGPGMTEFDGPDGWETEGVNTFTFTSDDQGRETQWITEFIDITDDPVDVVLDPNSTYLSLVVTSAVDESLGLGIGSTGDMNYSGGKGVILQDGEAYDTWNDFTGAPQIVWKLKFLVNSKQPVLNDNALQIIQNPVSDELRFNMEFANPTKVSYAIGTMTGSIIEMGQWEGVQNETQSLDVSKLANGSYLLRIQTENGIATRKFVVAR